MRLSLENGLFVVSCVSNAVCNRQFCLTIILQLTVVDFSCTLLYKGDGVSIGCNSSVFTALHGMRMRSSDENSVRLSVCPSHA